MNVWISHVKQFAIQHKLKYNDALKNPECKALYRRMKNIKGGMIEENQEPTFQERLEEEIIFLEQRLRYINTKFRSIKKTPEIIREEADLMDAIERSNKLLENLEEPSNNILNYIHKRNLGNK